MFITDYPIQGEYDGTWQYVELLAYDQDKYVLVRDSKGTLAEVKAGYIRKEVMKGKTLVRTHLRALDLYSLPFTQDAPRPTRRQVAQLLRKLRAKTTTYCLHIEKTTAAETRRVQFHCLEGAVRAMAIIAFRARDAQERVSLYLMEQTSRKLSWSQKLVLDVAIRTETVSTLYFTEHTKTIRKYFPRT